MSNERLRGAMAAAKLTKHALAQRLGINVKTVERWITQGRRPHPDMRLATARELGCDEAYLWPELLASRRAIAASVSEVVQFWPTRSEVPHDVWRSLMRKADRRMEVLVYAGGFLVESLDFADVVRRKAAAGVDIRVLLGASDSPEVNQRASEEGLPSLPQRCRSTLEYLWETTAFPSVSIRTHSTPLYNSIYRFDDSMLVNTHSYGAYAARSPVIHVERVPGGHLFGYYVQSFEAVWATARPALL
ncbi:helix-turn-helix transcriptional regulator [Nocardia farcinica]|uniref:helix-turn-helix domain-containing protein n=1 Tax=Nocardia farcinica TaxID=37329 RepID=UPI001896277F|nr:helix-turn-helix transcriptional regulator [Nocardia farcinica]MBF6262896.1 helix-turn-helix transcriptional regulator [Nocardia farcinica]MBF6281400.1 helix-turn-helix transcriptional regulator [Nocardia farcinica]MBF6305804.1 helix-turn-helix transcriptional regulator [Nocardia farcinica]MBF6376692.1 helix-turn-helix transcriptional regulator [Nocardia farcinica]MBF6377140.1 helix-turn-helix transcriptional regulator [Nocardia farcinica]